MPTPPDNPDLAPGAADGAPAEPTLRRTMAIFWASFVAVLVVFLGATLLQAINLPFGLLATSLFVFAACGLALPWIFNLAPTAFAGLRRLPLGLVLVGAALGLANMGFANFVMGALREVLPHRWSKLADDTSVVLVNASHWARVVIVLAAGVAAPIGEELFFRGWLQGTLARRYSTGWSIFLAAFVFSATHMDPVGFVARIELGMLFGILRAWSGSIYPSMAAHAAHNLISTAVLYLSPDPLAELHEPFDWGKSALIGAGSLAATLVLAYLLWRLAPRARAREPEPLVPSERARPTFVLTGSRLLAAVGLVLLLLLGAGALLQKTHRRLPGYGLVPDPFDRPPAPAEPLEPPR